MIFFNYCTTAEMYALKFIPMLIAGLICFAIALIFEGFALYTIARRQGYSKAWMSFVPFFNTYYIGVCSQKNNFYNIKIKKIAMVTAIIEGVLFLLYLFKFIVRYGVLEGGGYIDYVQVEVLSPGVALYGPQLRTLPTELNWAGWVFEYYDRYFLSMLDAAYMILNIILWICFFRTYACRKYIIFTVTCAITHMLCPFLPSILMFTVRKNKPIAYREYIIAKQTRDYYMYQQQINRNPYNNQYNNPYNNPYNSQSSQRPTNNNSQDPFSEDNNNSNNSNNSNNNTSPFDELN